MSDLRVNVTPWNTAWTADNPNGQFHDSLWEIAAEQATLSRMQTSGEDFNTAFSRVTPQEVRQHLDVICDRNGFQRLDGTGHGRNPHLIYSGNTIKVSIDPNTLGKPTADISPPTQAAKGSQDVASRAGNDPELAKKQDLAQIVPGFQTLPEPVQKSWIDTYSRKTVSPYQLMSLANNGTFNKLDEPGKQNVLALYGRTDQGYSTEEINKILGSPVDDGSFNKLRVISTAGFGQLPDVEQQQVLGKYGEDSNFRTALDTIVQQDNFKTKPPMEQAHALGILARYTDRDKGYPETGSRGRGDQGNTKRRTLILEKLYNDVLASGDFKLGEPGTTSRETGDQSKRIDDFAKDAYKIK